MYIFAYLTEYIDRTCFDIDQYCYTWINIVTCIIIGWPVISRFSHVSVFIVYILLCYFYLMCDCVCERLCSYFDLWYSVGIYVQHNGFLC